MKALTLFLIKSIVDNPDEVKVKEEATEFNYFNLDVSVAQNDMGKIIGKGGKIIKALRILLRLLALRKGKKINLQLLESLPSPQDQQMG